MFVSRRVWLLVNGKTVEGTRHIRAELYNDCTAPSGYVPFPVNPDVETFLQLPEEHTALTLPKGVCAGMSWEDVENLVYAWEP